MLSNIIVRLAIYYIALMLCTGGLFRAFPRIPYYIAHERARTADSASLDVESGATSVSGREVEGVDRLFDPATTIPVLVALLVALALTLPITWVYHWTHPRTRYDKAFAHTLLIVPIAIALVVFLVKGSVALAFGLAGIVAAIRFRTSLNEPMDGVYMFIVIGIGLAAGVQLLSVAVFASIIFNIVALTVWKTDLGARPAIISGWRLVAPDTAGQPPGASGTVQPEASGIADKPTRPYNALLRVHTTRIESALRTVTPVLESNAKQWQQAQAIQNENGTSTVEFDVRLKKSADLSALIREIEESEHVSKVELKMRKPAKE